MGGADLVPEVPLSDRLRLARVATLWTVPMALRAIIDLRVPLIMSKAGRGAFLAAEEIAAEIPNSTAFTATCIQRFLRQLTAYGVFDESVKEAAENGGAAERKYALNGTSSLLLDDEEGLSKAYAVLFKTDSSTMKCGHYLSETAIDGLSPFVKAHGTDTWTYNSQNPRLDVIFNKFMASTSKLEVAHFLRGYDGFKDYQGTLVDVGGGYGHVIGMIVEAHPHIKGINFDQPHVIAKAPNHSGVEHVAGDMFESIPKGDAIFLKWILHDWSDEDCSVILINVRKALPAHGKLMIVEAVLPTHTEEAGETQAILNIDLLMLTVNVNGRERSEAEFRKLVLDAGFSSLQVVYPGGGGFCALEAVV